MKPITASPGRSDFRDIIENDIYYVDKTDFIRQLIVSKNYVTLVTRPRRFGKSLNLSMLKYFLTPVERERNRVLFQDLKINENKDFMEKYQGKIPTVFLTMKHCKGSSYAEFLDGVRIMMQDFLKHHPEIEETARKNTVRNQRYENLLMNTASTMALKQSLGDIMDFLAHHYGKKVAVLIDEYDAPVFSIDEKMLVERNNILSFMSDFLGNALKDNELLSFALITGVHRIAKENLFSGFNNLCVSSVQDETFSDSFGFTINEIEKIADDFHMTESLPALKEWYDGYRFGETEIYNPWSIMSAVHKNGKLQAYWKHTSKNGLVMDALNSLSDISLLENVYKGMPIVGELDDGFTYKESMNDDRVLSLMVATGYLKPTKNLGDGRYELQIPNKEIRMVFKQEILEWCAPQNTRIYENFLYKLQEGKNTEAEAILKKLLSDIISYHDASQEAFYNGLLLGFLVCGSETYEITSNRESGDGRFDICMLPKRRNSKNAPGILIEVKYAKTEATMTKTAKYAIKQIKEKRYAESLRKENVNKIWLCGIAFFKKNAHVAIEQYLSV